MSLDAVLAAAKTTIVACGALANLVSPSCTLTFPVYNYTGHPLGIIDSNGTVIAKPAYSRIQYLEHGLYLTLDAGVGMTNGTRYDLLNRDGKKIALKVPDGTEFAGVYDLGSIGKERSSKAIDKLPPDAVIIFRKGGSFGLCSITGQELLEAKYGSIDSANGGRPLIFDMAVRMTWADRENGITLDDAQRFRNNKGYYFDVAAKKLVPLEQVGIWALAPEYSEGMRSFCCTRTKNMHGFINADGKVVIEPRYIRYEPFENGRAIVTVYPCASGSQCGDRYIIDKFEKRISPAGVFVMGRQNGVYFTGMKKSAGLMDGNGKWLYRPSEGSILSKRDGTFLQLNGDMFTVISSDGKVLKSMTGRQLNESHPRQQQRLRCVPKQAGVEEIDGSKWNFSGKVAENMLWFPYPIDEMGMSSTTYPITASNGEALAKRQTPYYSLTKFENDRFAMIAPGAMGKFDSTAFKSSKFDGTTPTDMFARFLREYNLIGMSHKEVNELLVDGNKLATQHNGALYLGIISGGCVSNDYIGVQIHFDEADKVKSWNFLDGNDEKSPSITHDVTLVPEVVEPTN